MATDDCSTIVVSKYTCSAVQCSAYREARCHANMHANTTDVLYSTTGDEVCGVVWEMDDKQQENANRQVGTPCAHNKPVAMERKINLQDRLHQYRDRVAERFCSIPHGGQDKSGVMSTGTSTQRTTERA